MIDTPHSRRLIDSRRLLALGLITAGAYLIIPIDRPRESPRRFSLLAQAFLRGELTIEINGGITDELIPTDDPTRFYCGYPPLPAAVLTPFVLLFGPTPQLRLVCVLLSVFNALIFYQCLIRVPERLGQSSFTANGRFMLALLFALGTATWDSAARTGDWHMAHATAMTAMLLALREYAGSNRPAVVGLFAGLAILARPTTAFASLFFAFPHIRRSRLGELARLAVGPIAAVLLLVIYNYARFGSLTEFAYDRMILHGQGKQLMETHGQFNPVFVLRNFFWFFLAPPAGREDGAFPWLGYDPRGLSLFVATPAMIYLFAALVQIRQKTVVRHAAGAALCCLIPLLLYYNSGYWQFGHRFSMDYLPSLMILLIVGMGPRPSRLAYSLIALSIAIHSAGILGNSVARLPISIPPA